MRWPWLALAFLPLIAWSKDAAVAVAALGVALVLATPATRWAALARRPGATAAVGVAFLAWALVAVAWSPTHHAADWFKAVSAIGLTWIIGRGIAQLSPAGVRGVATALIGAVLILIALLTVERMTGGILIGMVHSRNSTAQLFDRISPGLVVLSCLAFPTAHLLRQRTGNWRAGVVLIAASFGLALTYRMDAAPVALLSAGCAYAIARRWGARGFVVVAIGIAVIALAWGEVASLAWQHGEQTWLTHVATYNWGYRVEIWHRVWELIQEHVWLGHGFDSARVLGDVQPPAVVFLHPHNGLLQVWLELGAVGVVLLLGWGAVATRRFLASGPDTDTIAVAAATVTALSVFWLISFGIWHREWWLCATGLSFAAITLVRQAATQSLPSAIAIR